MFTFVVFGVFYSYVEVIRGVVVGGRVAAVC